MKTLQERVLGYTPPPIWSLGKLHQVLRVRKGNKNTGMREDNLLSLSYGHIVGKNIRANEGLLPESFETYQVVEPGDIVLRLTDLQNDKRSLRQGLVKQRGIVTSAYDALKVEKSHDPRFWAYTLLALDMAKYYYSLGGGVRQSIKFEDFPSESISLPDILTQRGIADFLDNETARIDRLIHQKQRLMDVMGDKRTTLRTLAATRGLNPGIPLKPSGVAWLGNVPEHWTVWKVGRFARVGNGSTPSRENPAYWNDGSYPWLNSSSVNHSPISKADQFVTDLALRECHLPRVQPGSVLVAITGQGKTRGTAALLTIESTINQHIAYITPRAKVVTGEYLHLALVAAYRELRAVSDDSGSTKGALTCADVAQFKVPLPPLAEQESIVSVVRQKTQGMDASISLTRQSIDQLREFRSALITAAVTGKIDVDHWRMRGKTDRRVEAMEQEVRA